MYRNNNIFKYRINRIQDHLLDFLGTPYYIEVLCAYDDYGISY